jgi:hypothetical protein
VALGSNGKIILGTREEQNLDRHNLTYESGRTMAQAVSRRPLTADARVRARVNPCGICGGPVFFRASISFHRRSPSHVIWGINSMSTGGNSSET